MPPTSCAWCAYRPVAPVTSRVSIATTKIARSSSRNTVSAASERDDADQQPEPDREPQDQQRAEPCADHDVVDGRARQQERRAEQPAACGILQAQQKPDQEDQHPHRARVEAVDGAENDRQHRQRKRPQIHLPQERNVEPVPRRCRGRRRAAGIGHSGVLERERTVLVELHGAGRHVAAAGAAAVLDERVDVGAGGRVVQVADDRRLPDDRQRHGQSVDAEPLDRQPVCAAVRVAAELEIADAHIGRARLEIRQIRDRALAVRAAPLPEQRHLRRRRLSRDSGREQQQHDAEPRRDAFPGSGQRGPAWLVVHVVLTHPKDNAPILMLNRPITGLNGALPGDSAALSEKSLAESEVIRDKPTVVLTLPVDASPAST